MDDDKIIQEYIDNIRKFENEAINKICEEHNIKLDDKAKYNYTICSYRHGLPDILIKEVRREHRHIPNNLSLLIDNKTSNILGWWFTGIKCGYTVIKQESLGTFKYTAKTTEDGQPYHVDIHLN